MAQVARGARGAQGGQAVLVQQPRMIALVMAETEEPEGVEAKVDAEEVEVEAPRSRSLGRPLRSSTRSAYRWSLQRVAQGGLPAGSQG